MVKSKLIGKVKDLTRHMIQIPSAGDLMRKKKWKKNKLLKLCGILSKKILARYVLCCNRGESGPILQWYLDQGERKDRVKIKSMLDIPSIIKQIDGLKPMSPLANKVLAIVEDPESSTDQLAALIVRDREITANLMRICNSAYLALPETIESVQKGIIYLGMDQVVDLVLMTGGAENLKGAHSGYNLREGELWKFSISSALMARDLAQKNGSNRNHGIFMAALLKDIGKVLLNPYMKSFSQEINFLISDLGWCVIAAEKEIIGIDHAELGEIIVEKWGLSPKTAHIIRNHHLPQGIENTDLEIALVYLADDLCLMMGMGEGIDELTHRCHREVVDAVGFSERDLKEVLNGYGNQLRRVEALINLS